MDTRDEGSDRRTVAAAQLSQLEQDRRHLEESSRPPGWMAPAVALVVGLWVLSPALESLGSQGDTSLVVSLIAVVVILSALGWTGVRTRARGPRAWAHGALLILVVLVCYSVSLGVVASGVIWWSALPAVLAFATTWWGLVRSRSMAREGLRG